METKSKVHIEDFKINNTKNVDIVYGFVYKWVPLHLIHNSIYEGSNNNYVFLNN
jgi:hypothetical protein